VVCAPNRGLLVVCAGNENEPTFWLTAEPWPIKNFDTVATTTQYDINE
jgi:hypothetical protein